MGVKHNLLRSCFSSTVWKELCAPHAPPESFDSMDNTLPISTVWCFSNNKPWISPEMKETRGSGELCRKNREGRAGMEKHLQMINYSRATSGESGKPSGHMRPQTKLSGCSGPVSMEPLFS